jgi:hypothetical protein
MLSKMLRWILIAVLIIFLLGFSFKFIRMAIGLVFLAIPIIAIAWVLKTLWWGRGPRAEVVDVDPEDEDEFEGRYPRLSRLNRRLRRIERSAGDRIRRRHTS